MKVWEKIQFKIGSFFPFCKGLLVDGCTYITGLLQEGCQSLLHYP